MWLNINKLSLNIDKTHYIIFTSTKNRVQSTNLVKINNISIKRVNNTKFLGVILDSELKWKLHIEFVKNKISKCIGFLTKAKKMSE